MPFGAYTVSDWGAKLDIYCDKYKEVEIAAPGIECREDYKRIQPLPQFTEPGAKCYSCPSGWRGWLNREPLTYRPFSPLPPPCKKLAGNRMLQDMLECPELVHGALAAITETTIKFCEGQH